MGQSNTEQKFLLRNCRIVTLYLHGSKQYGTEVFAEKLSYCHSAPTWVKAIRKAKTVVLSLYTYMGQSSTGQKFLLESRLYNTLPPSMREPKDIKTPDQSAEHRRKEWPRFWLRLCYTVILISNDRTSASKKINGMALIRTPTVSTTAFERTKDKFDFFGRLRQKNT